ncbi:methyltransferase-like protein 22 isoform X2 [Micropterus salmoides]|uniref:methyltransferase-like protein 22 isoform X2 n=1 Tax=Micropterus salmoides TaxID=27706 RepID=UPI0018EC5E46|nr:methyltransferase-like protein 22 isoform X2 [Micropterus salmoides]
MDQITFHHDTVLSDVHMLLPNARHLMIRLNSVGQPVFISKFKIFSHGESLDNSDPEKGIHEAEKYDDPREDEGKDTEGKDGQEGVEGSLESFLDEDGDLDITHRPRKIPMGGSDRDLVCPVILKQSNPSLEEEENMDDGVQSFEDVIRIEHTMATPLEDVGKQNRNSPSISLHMQVRQRQMESAQAHPPCKMKSKSESEHFSLPDQVWRGAFLLGDFILCNPVMFRGVTVLELGGGTGLTSIITATIAKTVYCTDVGEDLLSMCKRNVSLNRHIMEPAGGEVRVRQLDWLQQDLCTVCYDDDLTDGLFRTLYQLCSNFPHTCTIFISIEKRMNFSLRDMDVSCEAYDHFSHCLSQLQDLVDGRCSFRVEQLPCNFTQCLLYERIEQLELWKVTATPLTRRV